jgi:hypothetical protein
MTKREIAELMTIMQANYPDSFKGQSDSVVGAKIALWHEFFKDYPKELVQAAAKAFIANDTKGFMPNIGQINDCIQKITHRDDMTEAEAWGLVRRALRNGYHGAREEFEQLPERVQRLVGSPNQLKEWALMDVDTVESVIASNFQRSFRARKASDEEYERLPGEVKRAMQELSGSIFKAMPDVLAYALEEGGYEEFS